jgi:hypothetical protein
MARHSQIEKLSAANQLLDPIDIFRLHCQGERPTKRPTLWDWLCRTT